MNDTPTRDTPTMPHAVGTGQTGTRLGVREAGMNTTETTLDAGVLMERISEFAGRTIRFTSHGVDFRGELITVLDRGNGVPTGRRLAVIMRGNKEAITGSCTSVAVEFPR